MTKSEIITLAESLCLPVEDGTEDALTTYADLKAKIQAFQMAANQIEKLAIDQAAKWEKGKGEMHGFSFQTTEAGTKYFYDNDPVWEYHKDKEIIIALDRKAREKQLKALTESKEEIDPNTGEVFTACPPRKESTTTVNISFK